MSRPAPLVETRLVTRTRRVDDPGDLLDHLGAEGFAWLRDGVGFVTAGVAARVRVGCGLDRFEVAARLVTEVLDVVEVDDPVGVSASGPIAVGALPFASSEDGELVVPRRVVGRTPDGVAWVSETGSAGASPRLAPAEGAGDRVRPPSQFQVNGRQGHDRWVAAVEAVRAAIERGRVSKVVLARDVTVEADGAVDARSVLGRLRESHPSCFSFAAGRLVGATPELLVRRRGREVTSEPVAGSGPPSAVGAMRASPKERIEHRLVVDAVVAALAPRCEELVAPDEPGVVDLGNVAHLLTPVNGHLREPAPSVVDLVGRLHPTPAVAGTPTAEALRVIADVEGLDRGCYAGPVGWVDRHGDGEWAVALRCAEIDGHRARLFAGAGIVAGSEPEAEWVETQRKLEAMLVALVRP